MNYGLLALSGIIIMVAGFAIPFSILAEMKIYDFWLGITLMGIPMISGGTLFVIGFAYQNSEQPNLREDKQ